MRLEENILEMADFEPDFMGFIFFKGSGRFVGEDFEVPAALPPAIKRVGVFVNETCSEILRLADRHRLDLIQLHGDESPAFCSDVRGGGLKIIKVFSIGDDFDFRELDPYKKVVDYFLFDTKGKYYGGNGVAFHWDLLRKYDQEIPFFLSGGIAPQNVSGTAKLKNMNLFALDVNSGVERKIGIKDAGLVRDIVSKMKNQE